MERKIIFFMGKGGVGKSTIACLLAVRLSDIGKKVLLTSLDPAHNLSDIFGQTLSNTPTMISMNLQGIEINQEHWIQKYLKETQQKLTQAYAYLTTFSLDKHFNIMRHAPAIEEHALLSSFSWILKNYPGKDYYLFDLPPTALAIKFFALPQLSLVWLESLIKLRDEIIEKENIASKLRIGKMEIGPDKLRQNLLRQKEFYTSLNSIFRTNASTKILLIKNPDNLSQMEGERIEKRLAELNLVQSTPVMNYIHNKDKMHPMKFSIPASQNPLSGFAELQKFSQKHLSESTIAVIL